jgi:lipopolysaccharide heptosyltransferase II
LIEQDGAMHFDAERICVIKPSALGDVAQALPLLPVLRQRFPRARITWVINRELAEMLTEHPHVDDVISFDRHGGAMRFLRLLHRLHGERFDLVFDLQGLLRTGLMTLATGARCRVGLETAREGSRWACHITLPGTGDDVPAHERYWRVAEELGGGDLPRRAFIAVSDADRAWVQSQVAALPRPLIGLHAGARWETKRWPAEKFAQVAQRTLATHGGSVVVVGGRDDAGLGDRIVRPIVAAGHAALNLAGRTSIKRLIELLRSFEVLVSNDSGPLHLATELGTPVVGVYTCTSPHISGPSGVGHELVATGLPCAGGYHTLCPHRGSRRLACFDDVAVDRVAAALGRVLDRIKPASSSTG